MRVVGLTGGIGSGKTTVANFFSDLGIPVYIADDAGKRLMIENVSVKAQVQDLIGNKAYAGNTLNRKYIASKVFKDSQLLENLNKIIHPAVAEDFIKWKQDQDSEYVIYEAAILFETGKAKQCDFTILVSAPKEIRLNRLQKRDKSSRSEIEDRMSHQWSDEKKSKLADFVIKNEDLSLTKSQVAHIHSQILKAGKNS